MLYNKAVPISLYLWLMLPRATNRYKTYVAYKIDTNIIYWKFTKQMTALWAMMVLEGSKSCLSLLVSTSCLNEQEKEFLVHHAAFNIPFLSYPDNWKTFRVCQPGLPRQNLKHFSTIRTTRSCLEPRPSMPTMQPAQIQTLILSYQCLTLHTTQVLQLCA
ncbi:uncharacterized protein LOC119587192 [Penaeus monodon]|uniref:uncharacterized protein LOC119587192 n=1 Tax=Penaeus monodon TaxID=6687 RepID=UPI0018A74754|nr:uncharacterized protein LOC119587192 [Penaeus monodon]